jgi:hypothetical protein
MRQVGHGVDWVGHGHHAAGVDRTHLLDDGEEIIQLAEQSLASRVVKMEAGELRQPLDIVESQ